MSQLLVGVINNTTQSIYIWNSESSGNTATIPAGQVMVIQGRVGHWNIPDCSAEGYFAAHHMEIRPSATGPAMFSFWDDDSANYIIQTCPGTSYNERTVMAGASNLGNNANVVINVQSSLSAMTALVVGS
jgi:hypothetical protein